MNKYFSIIELFFLLLFIPLVRNAIGYPDWPLVVDGEEAEIGNTFFLGIFCTLYSQFSCNP